MQITEENKKRKGAMMTDLWSLIKQYDQPEADDAYWAALVQAVEDLLEKYGNNPVIQAAAFAFMDEKNDQYKKEVA